MNKLTTAVDRIAEFLCLWIQKNDGFKSRSFYGETFSLAFLSRMNILTLSLKSILIESYENLDKQDSQFHWEFNNYALTDYIFDSKDIELNRHLFPLKFKNTPCTNWTLLRNNVKIKLNYEYDIAIKEAKNRISEFQLNSGLILDDKGVKSFQYHCFSLAMIAEMYDSTGDQFFLDSFLNGLGFIRKFILRNGESLYIGRGQNQSFGYGTLIYILSIGLKICKDQSLVNDLSDVLNFIIRFQNSDGSFPLVINGREESIPDVVDINNPEFSGWYPYNNYFDYLPFMAFFLKKALDLLSDLDLTYVSHRSRKDYRDHDFIVKRKINYDAVLSKPGGYWTNDMCIPYIVSKKSNLTPCYGGEQFQDSLYSELVLPLPVFYKLKKSIRWRARSFYIHNVLVVLSPLGIMIRNYKYENEYIEIVTRVFSVFKFYHVYSLFDKKNILSEFLEFNCLSYSASGELNTYIAKQNKHKLIIKIM